MVILQGMYHKHGHSQLTFHSILCSETVPTVFFQMPWWLKLLATVFTYPNFVPFSFTAFDVSCYESWWSLFFIATVALKIPYCTTLCSFVTRQSYGMLKHFSAMGILIFLCSFDTRPRSSFWINHTAFFQKIAFCWIFLTICSTRFCKILTECKAMVCIIFIVHF